MKLRFILCAAVAMVMGTQTANAQKTEEAITTVFKVYGACGECKERIEGALKTKGVSSAVWDVTTKELSVSYDPQKITLEKIEDKVVRVGHDIAGKKADQNVYDKLPACCKYREMEDGGQGLEITSSMDESNDTAQSAIPVEENIINGTVLYKNGEGNYIRIPGATVAWVGSALATSADQRGYFMLGKDVNATRISVSSIGFYTDTIDVANLANHRVVLRKKLNDEAETSLSEVVVSTKKLSSFVNKYSPIRTETLTGKSLLKAACCNLSESFETNPSVDVSFSDAVTGAKQIELLGLSGNYTQLTVENLPGPRGLATPLGLNSIAGPWIESIQLLKGTGSVVNGYESIAGQINVELKKPEASEKLLANAYVNNNGKTDFNLNLATKINDKWHVGLLLHDDFLANKSMDYNKDGFRDAPTGNNFAAINRFGYNSGNGVEAQFGVKILNGDLTGGETAFRTASDKGTTNHYGLGINTKRYEVFGKMGYIFPEKNYRSIGLQVATIDHKQDSYFGATTYNAHQQTFYSNLIYQSIIHSSKHIIKIGASFVYDKYDEDFRSTNYKRAEKTGGTFVDYTFTPGDKFSLVAGLRGDYHNLFGFFVTPRLHVRYEPIQNTTIRASIGRGQRTANIFAENSAVFVSNRQLVIQPSQGGKAYGLNPEIAWNKGVTIDQKFKMFKRNASVAVDFFRNDFRDQVIVDLENPREVKFSNLDGKSYANSFQVEWNSEPVKDLELKMAYRYYDVKATYSTGLMQRPLISAHRAFVNLAYAAGSWKMDYTVSYNGKKRIPNTAGNPSEYRLQNYSPSFITMNAQVTKSLGTKHPMDIYIGGENLTGFYQTNAIISANAPFSPYFDASLVWGPLSGRMIYLGWRMTIK